jgi:hypothetical protein
MNSALSFARNRFAQNSLKFIQLFVRLIAVLFFLTSQGQCKPNAESSLYAEVQPVLAISIAKLRRDSEGNKKTA